MWNEIISSNSMIFKRFIVYDFCHENIVMNSLTREVTNIVRKCQFWSKFPRLHKLAKKKGLDKIN